MWNFTKNNKIYWYLLILISLFILVLVTRTQISSLQIQKDEISINQSKEISLSQELTRLNEIRNKISNDDIEIEKYIVDLSEDEIINYIYSKIEQDNLIYSWWIVEVRNISMSKWDINEMWFNEITLNLSLRVPSEDRMIKILDFFTWDKSKYKFYISSFNYPSSRTNWVFNVNIPLKIFYK